MYPYENKPAIDKISELTSRIQVLEWDAVNGEIPTWYAYEQINIMENKIEELQDMIHDSLMNDTRRIG